MADLKLNGLTKQADGVLLERYDHCEVPAGCGGVILRWVRPDAPQALTLGLVAFGAGHAVWLDGETPKQGVVTLSPGFHVLAIRVDAPAKGAALIASLRGKHWSDPLPALLTRGDDTWRATTQPPDDAWLRPEFDDRPWTPLPLQPAPPPEKGLERYTLESLARAGALPVGPAGAPPPTLWVRRRFTLSAKGIA